MAARELNQAVAGPAGNRRGPGLATGVRVVWGLVFVGGAVVNLLVTLPHPEVYEGFAELAFFPFYRDLLLDVAVPNATLITALVVVFELTAGALVLSTGRLARLGLLATVGWTVFVWPAMGWYTIGSPLLMIIPCWLLRNQDK
jgi:hypothetical protein